MEQACKLWLTIYAFQTWSPQHQAHCDAGLLIIPKKKDLGNNLLKRKKTSKTALLRCRLWWGSRNCQAERRMRGRVQNCCWRTLNQMVSLHFEHACKIDPIHITTRLSILCMTHQMSRKKRNHSVGWTVPYEKMNYKWYLMVLSQYMTILAGTWSV